jgi:Flp pilus assembly protein TadG
MRPRMPRPRMRRLRMPRPPMPKIIVCARRDERGSFTFMVVFWLLMTMVLAGLVVDGGLAVTERQRIGDIAEQAARAAADDLNQNDLRDGNYRLADGYSDKCTQVVKASGLDPTSAITKCVQTGTITLRTGQVVPVVEVDLTFTYSPILLSLFFSTDFTANASATAYPQPGF